MSVHPCCSCLSCAYFRTSQFLWSSPPKILPLLGTSEAVLFDSLNSLAKTANFPWANSEPFISDPCWLYPYLAFAGVTCSTSSSFLLVHLFVLRRHILTPTINSCQLIRPLTHIGPEWAVFWSIKYSFLWVCVFIWPFFKTWCLFSRNHILPMSFLNMRKEGATITERNWHWDWIMNLPGVQQFNVLPHTHQHPSEDPIPGPMCQWFLISHIALCTHTVSLQEIHSHFLALSEMTATISAGIPVHGKYHNMLKPSHTKS